MSEQKTAVGHHTNKKVWKCFVRRGGDVLTIAFTQIMIRALVFGAVIGLPYLTDGRIKLPIACAFALLMYIFVLIPMRCQGGEKLRRLFFTRNLHSSGLTPYQKWLRTGLLRYFRGLLWGVPLFALLVFLGTRAPEWYEQIMHGEDAVKYMQRIQLWAGLIGKEPSTIVGLAVGAGVALLAAALLALLFAYGWWRDMPVEYLPSRSVGPEKTIRWARHIRRNHRRELIPHALLNMALFIPGVAAVAVVAYRYLIVVKKYLNSFLTTVTQAGIYETVAMVRKDLGGLIRGWPMPTRNQLLALGVVLLIVWLPLCIFRKMRNASLIADMMKKEHHSHHSSRNSISPQRPAAGPQAEAAEPEAPKQTEPAPEESEKAEESHAD